MEKDRGDRQDDGGTGGTTDSTGRLTADIFDQIAMRVIGRDPSLLNRYTPDEQAAILTTFATEVRTAMQELDVQVRVKPPQPPKPTRTRAATAMLLLAALENEDLYIRECSLTLMGDPPAFRAADPLVWFDVGQFAVQVRFDVDSGLQVVQWDHVTQFKLNNGQILAVPSRHERPAAGRDTLYGAPAINHPLYWLRTYRPRYDVDRFSPILQHQLAQAYAGRPAPRVIRRDEEGRTYTWTLTGELVMWKDGRGRVIHE